MEEFAGAVLALGLFVGGPLLMGRKGYWWSLASLIFTLGYLLPWAISADRRLPNTASVGMLNLFLGWTLIGWVVALALAVRTQPGVSTPKSSESPLRAS